MITERLVSAKVHPHCLPIPHSLSVMRYSAMPAVFVGLSWFAQRADAFVVGPPRGSSSNQRTCSGCLSQYQPLSTMEATRSLAVGTAQLEARQKRKSLDTMSASSQENEAKWETTPKAMVSYCVVCPYSQCSYKAVILNESELYQRLVLL